MKNKVVDFIARCLECKKAMAKNKHPYIVLQPFPITEWKGEVVIMDFIIKFPRTN
jgi:hypothetical protein